MQEYRQRLQFTRDIVIKAKDAAEANAKLEEIINDIEFSSSVDCDGYQEFEDEPVECPECKGNGVTGDVDGEDEQECKNCKGEGSVPFVAAP